MLKAAMAARYCGMSTTVFHNRCPVRPSDFGDKRLELFDKVLLDEWLDHCQMTEAGVVSVEDALIEFRRQNATAVLRKTKR